MFSGSHPMSKDGQSSSHVIELPEGHLDSVISYKSLLKVFIMRSKTVGLEELPPMLTNVIYLAGF